MTSVVTATSQSKGGAHPGRLGNTLFGGSAWIFAILVLILLAGVMISLVVGAAPAFSNSAFPSSGPRPGPRPRQLWRAGAPLRHADHRLHRHDHRRADQPGYRDLPDRAVPDLPQAADFDRGRTAGGRAQHHLRHVGPVRVGAPDAEYIEPAIIATFGSVPGIGILFQGPPYGIGVFTAGIILSAMVLPYMVSIMRDVFEAVPPQLREFGLWPGRHDLGSRKSVVVPYSRVGVIGAFMLSLGRALGETMAVTFVIGNSYHITASFLAPGTHDRVVARQRIRRSGRAAAFRPAWPWASCCSC